MRVVFNRVAAAGPRTGVGHYVAQLLRCLQARAEESVAVETFPGDWVQGTGKWWARLRARLQPGTEDRPLSDAYNPSWRGVVAGWLKRRGQALLARRFRRLCGRRHFDLYHEPNFIPLPSDLPTVVTLHDLSVLLHPQWHPAERVAYYEQAFRRGLDRCTHFLAISESGRQEILHTLGLRPEQVTRTYMGVRPGLGPLPAEHVRADLRRAGFPERYLLYLGTLEPRKNVLTLLRAYCALPGHVRDRYPLVLVGGWGWNAGDVAAFLDREGRRSGILHRGYLPDELLPAVYNGARALVFPSFYEGFGLPPVEMMACGGAVLASTAEAVAETVAGRGHLIDPSDLDGWRAALLRVAEDDDWWRLLRQGVQSVARRYTWERCAEDTLGAYRVCQGSAASRQSPAAA
jgi:alpha-1,3-rhamnosyl/mannosyltransferase